MALEHWVYKLTNKINLKSYIGVTKNFEKRFYSHQFSKFPIGVALRFYGEQNFTKEILLSGAKSYCFEMEIACIKKYDTFRNGYNCTEGGDCGPNNTGKTLKKRMTGPMSGKTHSLETKTKIGKANTGKTRANKKTLEQLKTRRKAHATSIRTTAYKVSDEARLNMSRAALNRAKGGLVLSH